MKRLTVETGVDVRRWDTYTVEVPDDWTLDGEEAEKYLLARIRKQDAKPEYTEYENEHQDFPAGELTLIEWKTDGQPA